jgi:hypothetical protein
MFNVYQRPMDLAASKSVEPSTIWHDELVERKTFLKEKMTKFSK